MDSFSALAAAALASMAAIQLSRSAALVAWKVCLWPWCLKWNSLEPSLETSPISDYTVSFAITLVHVTYQVEDTRGSGLVLGALGQEHQTLTGLAGPGGNGVGDGRLLVLVKDVQVLGLDGFILEVEEALGETQAPV